MSSTSASTLTKGIDDKATANVIRCKQCHNLKGRINRCEETRVAWANTADSESRVKMMRECADVYGDALAMKFTENTTESRADAFSSEFNDLGKFMDEDDLTEKYKNKPEQLKNIFANATTTHCAVRNVTLWADPEYTLNLRNSASASKTRARTMERDEIVKKAKKPKVVKTEIGPTSDDGTADRDVPAMSAANVTALAAAEDKQKTTFVPGGPHDVLDARVKAVQDHIPRFSLLKFYLKSANLQQNISECDLAVQNEKGRATALKENLKAAAKEYADARSSIITFAKEAEGHVRAAAREEAA